MGKVDVVFDIGGTTTRIALYSQKSLHEVQRFATDSSKTGPKSFLHQLSGVVGGQTVGRIVGDVAALFDEKGMVRQATNLPDWQYCELGQALRQEHNAEVQLYNDIVLCGMGECHNGSGITKGVMAYVTVSTGVNACRIVDGAIDPTMNWFDVGRQLVGEDEKASWEGLIGGAAITRRTGKRPEDMHDAMFWHGVATHLARGLFNLRLFWDPDVIVLGGPMMRDIPLPAVQTELRRLKGSFSRAGELRRASLGDNGGIMGGVNYLQKTL